MQAAPSPSSSAVSSGPDIARSPVHDSESNQNTILSVAATGIANMLLSGGFAIAGFNAQNPGERHGFMYAGLGAAVAAFACSVTAFGLLYSEGRNSGQQGNAAAGGRNVQLAQLVAQERVLGEVVPHVPPQSAHEPGAALPSVLVAAAEMPRRPDQAHGETERPIGDTTLVSSQHVPVESLVVLTCSDNSDTRSM